MWVSDIKLLGLENQLELETGRSTRWQDPGSLGARPPQGQSLQSPGESAAQHWQAGHCGQDTHRASHLARCSCKSPEPSATTLLAPRRTLLSSCTQACWQMQGRGHPAFALGPKGRPEAPLPLGPGEDCLVPVLVTPPASKNQPRPTYLQ